MIDRWTAAAPGFKRVIPWIIGLMLLSNIVAMIAFKLRGGDATSLLGGTVALIMVIVAIGVYGREGLEKLTEHGRLGFRFGIKIFTPVFLIAVGGGCIVPWALIPAAGITGTDPVEVARRNLIPTLAGLVGVVVVSIFML